MKPVDFNTTTELLAGLHQGENRAAWTEFDQRYRPILVGFLRRMGLNDADAADTAQESLTCFVQDYRKGKYDREQGRLRNWLIGIARCRLADLRRATGRRRIQRGESAMQYLPDESDAAAIWEAEQRRCIFEQAVGELRATARFKRTYAERIRARRAAPGARRRRCRRTGPFAPGNLQTPRTAS